MTYNHERPVEDFEEQLNIIRSAGFNPIGVSQMYFEDTFIFETQDEASRAYRVLERDKNENWIGKVVGWWYGRKKFEDSVIKYEQNKNNSTVLVHWLK